MGGVLRAQKERLNPGVHNEYQEKVFSKNENKGVILNDNYRFFKRVS